MKNSTITLIFVDVISGKFKFRLKKKKKKKCISYGAKYITCGKDIFGLEQVLPCSGRKLVRVSILVKVPRFSELVLSQAKSARKSRMRS